MDLRRIDLNLLVTLDVLLRDPSVTAAAQHLNLSQPAVSARLTRLRELFGDPLLVQRGRNLVPTPLAREIAPRLQRILAELGGVLQTGTAFDPATAERTFRIAASDDFHAAVSSRLIDLCRREAPNSRIALMTPPRDRVERMLYDGDIDLIMTIPSFTPAGAASETLYRERFVCAARRDHPALAGILDLDTYCRLPHLLVSPFGGGFHGHVDGILSELGRSRRVVASVSSFLIVPQILARSDLISTVPSRLTRLWAGQLAVAEPPLEIAGYAIQAVWNPSADADKGLAWLRDRLRALCAEPEPG